MPYEADIAIIGAGVIGLAIASEVARQHREVYLLEKNETFGKEQSSRNSEVIHAGLYYKKDSLKAKMCLEGNNLLYELCESKGIAYKKCGKIIVAADSAEEPKLEKLYQRGLQNGAPLRMLSRSEMNDLEPNLRGTEAFFAPTSGIVDSYGLMTYLQGSARSNGAHVVYRTEATGIDRVSDGYRIRVNSISENAFITARVLINCAGLHSDKVAKTAGIDIDKAEYRLNWCKGEYYTVTGGKNRLINRLIYPVPTDISVGVHVCLDVNWRLRLGPHFYFVDELDYKVDESRKTAFLESSIMRALPFIEPSDLAPETSGILAMLQGPGRGLHDFVIRHEYDRGLPGFINLIGIESPGLTSSLAIARHVDHLVSEIIGS